jgi:signal transduction histidine kinase
MKPEINESSVYSVFRLFIGVRLLISVLSFISQWLMPAPPFFSRFEYSSILSVVETSLLLGYLSWPWLRIKMGKIYLPVALGVATLAPVIEYFLSIAWEHLDELGQARLISGQWQLIIFLLVPLILVSWEYSLGVVVIYCASLAILDGAGIAILSPLDRQVWFALGVVFFRTLIFLFLGYIISRLVSEQRRQNSRLAQANRQLASYATTLEQLTISRERNRLAREFHDTVAHTLSGVAVQLEAVSALWQTDQFKAQAMLDNSLVAIRKGLNETRRAIQALRATPLEDLGLALAVKNLARATADKDDLELDLQVADTLPALSPDVEHGLYRILEEGLRNIGQHARARTMSVRLGCQDSLLKLVVKDDGQGFANSIAAQEDHFGLRGMHEYADSIGAKMKIRSEPGQGTTIELFLEVKNGSSANL